MKHFISVIALALTGAFHIAGVAAQDAQSFAFQIPGFQPDDAESNTYFVAEVRTNGWGLLSVRPDESGKLEGALPTQRVENGLREAEEEPWAPQHYFFAVNNISEEKRYTFDLQDVPVVALVVSLGQSLNAVPRGAPRRRPSSSVHFGFGDQVGDQTVSLYGDNLTLQQTLDLIRSEAGCDVIQVEGGLIIDWCG